MLSLSYWLCSPQKVTWCYLFALIALFTALLKDAQARGSVGPLHEVAWGDVAHKALLVEWCVWSVIVSSDAKNASLRLRLARKWREN